MTYSSRSILLLIWWLLFLQEESDEKSTLDEITCKTDGDGRKVCQDLKALAGMSMSLPFCPPVCLIIFFCCSSTAKSIILYHLYTAAAEQTWWCLFLCYAYAWQYLLLIVHVLFFIHGHSYSVTVNWTLYFRGSYSSRHCHLTRVCNKWCLAHYNMILYSDGELFDHVIYYVGSFVCPAQWDWYMY